MTTTLTEHARHHLNPMKLRGLLRRIGLSRHLARQLAMWYQKIYDIVLDKSSVSMVR